MGRHKQSDSVAQLVKLGYSVTRARKALKECGGNVSNARHFLQQQQQAGRGDGGPSDRRQDSSAARGSCDDGDGSSDSREDTRRATSAVLEEGLPRCPGNTTSAAEDAPTTKTTTATRRAAVGKHPCVVQHGSCRYGDQCYLRDLPGDICIHYFHGPCIYGDECHFRHRVDGKDIATWKKNTSAPTFDVHGERYVIAEQLQGKVSVAKRLPAASSAQDTAVAQSSSHSPPALYASIAAANACRRDGGEHKEKREEEEEEDDEGMAAVRAVMATFFGDAGRSAAPPLPTPYLDILRRAQPELDARSANVTKADGDEGEEEGSARKTACAARQLLRVQHLLPPPPSPSPPSAPTPARRSEQTCGSETSGSGGGSDALAGQAMAKHPCIAQYGYCKYGDACRHAQRDADICVHFLNGHCRYSAAECPYRHDTSNNHNNKDNSSGRGGGAEVGGTWSEVSSLPASDPADPSAGEDEDEGLREHFDEFYYGVTSPTSVASEAECSDAELTKLLRLLELFPDEEPATLLLALRGCGGVVEAVPDMIYKLQQLDEVDSDEALARLLAEEEQEAQAASPFSSVAAASQACDRTQALPLLCELFEEQEPNAIADTLTRCQDNVAEAYEQLLFAREHIARMDYPAATGAWRNSAKLLDAAHLERLYALYKPIDRQTVSMVYEMLEQDSTRARCVLDEMLAAELGATQTPSAGPRAKQKKALRATRSAQLAGGAAGTPPAAARDASSLVDDYRAIEAEVQAHEDWRRVRAEAYMLNSCRLRVVQRATQAFLAGKGDVAKRLSREGKELEREYRRLNRLAMLALELERRKQSPVSTLDLHGFHVDEVREVLLRRVRECARRRITRLTVVFGKGLHSRRGGPQIGPTVVDLLRNDAELKQQATIVSFKQALLELRIHLQ